MSKALVAFFSVSGVTKSVAKSIAEVCSADLFEIKPETAYTIADIDYTNKESRCSVEMGNLDCRPAMCPLPENMDQYDTVLVGYPVWWGREPSIVDTFLDSVDWNGKTIIPFCTSAGSGVEGGAERIKALTCGRAVVAEGKRIAADTTTEDLKKWICG